jgi:tetratricopeptide (TPR) repeat protein
MIIRQLFSSVCKQPVLPLLVVLVSAVVAVAAYLQALNYPYFSDDITYLPGNAKLIGLQFSGLWRLFTEPYNCCHEFLPLRDFSYWLDINLFGFTPAASRIQNIVLYLLCLPIVYVATSSVWRYFRPADAGNAPWVAATVTALFALHPALVESVVWISGRKYILPNLFAMLALWLAVSARREQGLSTRHAAATLIAFVAVMFSKSSYVGVAPLIALLWVLFWLDIPKDVRRRTVLLWPFAILFLAAIMTLVFVVMNESFDSMPFYFGIEAVTRTFAVLGWLACLAVTPASRHFLYPVFEDANLYIMVAIGALVMISAVAGGFLTLRKRSLEGFALIAFLLMCIPYMQLMPNHPPSLVSDRYLTFAVWPAILLIVALLWRLGRVPRIILLLAIALPWAYQTIERPRDWRSMDALYNADLHAYPGYYMPAMYEINNVLLPQGLYPEAYKLASSIPTPELRDIMINVIKADYAVSVGITSGRPEDSMSFLEKLGPDYKQRPAEARWNSSVFFFYGKNLSKLESEWEKLAKRFTDDPSVRYNAGLWMLGVHKAKHAVVHLRAATESQLMPENARGTAFRNLGLALISSGNIDEAEAPLNAALQQSPPDDRAYCLLVAVYKSNGRLAKADNAAAECRKRAGKDSQSVQINPEN